jgi:hypothetical protein
MNRATFGDRILAITFIFVVLALNIIAFRNPSNETLVQAALAMDSSVVGGFIALQTQRPRNPPPE